MDKFDKNKKSTFGSPRSGSSIIAGFDTLIEDAMDTIYKSSTSQTPLSKTWHKVLLGIKSSDKLLGQKIFDHTEVTLDSGTLKVTTDHPGWAQIIQTYASFIIKGFSFYGHPFKVSAIRVSVR